MPATTGAQTSFLNLLFNNTTWTGVGDAGGILQSVGAGNLYVSLHTADPGATASPDQTTDEIATAAYDTYARQAVARTSGGWAVQSSAGLQTTVQNAAVINTWSAGTGASAGGTVTYFGIGTDSSGAGQLLFYGLLTTGPLTVGDGITPSTPAGAIKVTVT